MNQGTERRGILEILYHDNLVKRGEDLSRDEEDPGGLR